MDLTQTLLALVSARSDITAASASGRVEADVALVLETMLREQFPWLTVAREPVEEGRDNLWVTDGVPVELLFMGHMDTVEHGEGWTRRALGELADGKLYGRGAGDMKAGIVAILEALRHAHEKGRQGVAALFYCDEEYEFSGMKAFLKRHDELRPRLVVCPEPTQERLLPGCRGIVDWRFVIEGKAAHAARPHLGVSAFEALNAGVEAIKKMLDGLDHPDIGKPTINVGYIHCGPPSQTGNIIPERCEATVEVRTTPAVTREAMERVFIEAVEAFGARVSTVRVASDIGSFLTPREKLTEVEEAATEILGKAEWGHPKDFGYSDAQMIAAAWSVPTVIWGPKCMNMHGADEYVELASVERVAAAFRALVDKFPADR
jgi:acetylornithine deacetylase/succinyl-diaminopimelate desuccinylase-like protein